MPRSRFVSRFSKAFFLCLAIQQSFIMDVVRGYSDPWGDNLRPKLHTDYMSDNSGLTDKFLGNQTHKDYFKLLRKDGASLLIGARNVIYNLTMPYLYENQEQRITWNPTEKDRELCLLKGKSEDDCQNYIRVLAKTEDGKLLVCGTNAYNPKCRFYSHNDTHINVDKEFSGKGFCPYDPRHNSTALYTNGELFSGTVADFSASDALIIKDQLRTEQYDFKHLNGPNFVSSLEDSDHVYFFFRESAVEYMNCGKTVFSRVARVCKNDKGGPHKFNNKWTSFIKTRLNCSVPGDLPFYFDEIQSTSNFIERNQSMNRRFGNQIEMVFYGVFTTPDNSIAGSAICTFKLSDILSSFEDGPFKAQESVNSNWLPTSPSQIPDPRPGLCYNNSITLPESSLNFIKRHSLMDLAVPNAGNAPFFVKTGLGERLTVIAIDPGVRSLEGQLFDMVFVGTTHGRVLKLANLITNNNHFRSNDPVLIESIQLFPYHIPVRNILVVNSENEPGRLIILSDHEVISVPMHRCGSEAAQTCEDCIALQDPYCAWNLATSKCAAHEELQSNPDELVQDISVGFHIGCPATRKEDTTEVETVATTSTPSSDQTTATIQTTGITVASTSAHFNLEQGAVGNASSVNLDIAKSGEKCLSCPCNCTVSVSEPDTEMTTERKLQIPTFVPFYDEDNFDEGRSRQYKTSDFSLDTRRLQGNGLNYPSYQPSSKGENVPIYSESTLALAIISTAILAMSVGFLCGFWTSKKCPKPSSSSFRQNSTSSDMTTSDNSHPSKDILTIDLVDKTMALRNRATAAISRAGVRCSKQFGRIYDHRRRHHFGFRGTNTQHEQDNPNSSSSSNSPPATPSLLMTVSTLQNRIHMECIDSGYTTPSNLTNNSVATQDTSVSTPTSSPSPMSTSSNGMSGSLTENDGVMVRSVNSFTNPAIRSGTTKHTRPIVSTTTSLPMQHDISSPYGTINGRSAPIYRHYSNGSTTTIPRRASPNETMTQDLMSKRASLVTTSTTNVGPEGTLQKVKRVYL